MLVANKFSNGPQLFLIKVFFEDFIAVFCLLIFYLG